MVERKVSGVRLQNSLVLIFLKGLVIAVHQYLRSKNNICAFSHSRSAAESFPTDQDPRVSLLSSLYGRGKKMGRKQKDATQITQIAVLSFLIRKCDLKKKNKLFIYFGLCRVSVAAQAFL